MKKLENKVAVITGGNSGIGLATAKLFAQHGARVTITGRNEASLREAEAAIGPDTLGLVSDAANLDAIGKLYEQVAARFGKIDVLILNAGIYNVAPIADFTEAQFDEMSDVNFKGVFFSIQKALPHLNDGAVIVLTGSTASHKGLPNVVAYGATKAAIRAMARGFSAELLDRQIRVNVLSPGPVDTPVFARGGASPEELAALKARYAAGLPVKRMATAEEIAEGFLYLASDDSRFMVGGELLLDGGRATL